MISLTLVIVSWNAREYLQRCLQSIDEARLGLDVDVLVVDNASEDGSAAMVRSHFPKVHLIENASNVGFAKANNQALHCVESPYTALINSDVELHPNCLNRLYAYMERHARVGLCAPKILNGDGTIQSSVFHFPSVQTDLLQSIGFHRFLRFTPVKTGLLDEYFSYDQPKNVDALSGCFWLLRTSLWKQLGGLDEEFFMYGEDVDFCQRVHQSGYEIAFVPTATATHYGGGSSRQAPIPCYIELQKSRVLYWNKHYGTTGKMFAYATVMLEQAVRLCALSVALAVCRSSRTVLENKWLCSVRCFRYFLLLPSNLRKVRS